MPRKVNPTDSADPVHDSRMRTLNVGIVDTRPSKCYKLAEFSPFANVHTITSAFHLVAKSAYTLCVALLKCIKVFTF